MGVEHRSVVLIGVDNNLLSWGNLTDEGQREVIREVISNSPVDLDESNDEQFWSFEDQAIDYFKGNRGEILTDWFNFSHIGSYWTGNIEYSGVDVGEVSLQRNYTYEISQFKRWFNLEPDLHIGVLEY